MSTGLPRFPIQLGDTQAIVVTFNDDQNPPQPIDMSGKTWLCQVRTVPASILVGTFDVDTTDADAGTLVLRMDGPDSEQLGSGQVLQLRDLTIGFTWFKVELLASADYAHA